MAPIARPRICSGCGDEVPVEALEGLCPRCVAPLAFATGGSSQPECGVISNERIRYVGDYELLEEIARGGMGVVYSARQVSLNRIVAVRMILAGQLASAAEVRRFRAEAEVAATLQHPNIVTIHEIGDHEGQPFFAMDFIEGRSLADLVRDGLLPAKRAATLMKTVAEAIHHAHERGILHRDLKPSNIVLDILGQPHVTDFGLARRLTSDLCLLTSGLTLTGQILGTPGFMSPEQVSGRRDAIGMTADIYSLGAILYTLITGRPPFQGETMQQVFEQVTNAAPLSPGLLNPGVPRDLEAICLKCLEKEPSKRYACAGELADEFDRFLKDEPIQARPIGPAGRLWRWCLRKPALAFSSCFIFVLILILLIVSPIAAYRINQARRIAEANELKAHRNLYAADMTLAFKALDEGNTGRARELLEKYSSRNRESGARSTNLGAQRFDFCLASDSRLLPPDLRGWEWHYL